MSDSSLLPLTVTEAARLIAARKISPVDLVEACIARAEALQDKLHLFITLMADEARAAAAQAEAEIAAGILRGPLHGVPYAVKDNYHVKGVKTTAGSRLMLDYVADETATTIERLEAAGAILLGKLNTWEYGTGNGEVHEDLPFPLACNPWNTGRFTGGSSTGAGAAVAAGVVPFALGSDTGGSVRLPAAATGVQGMKATFGRISRAGLLPNCWSSDVPGPLTWTSADNAIVLSVMAGDDPRDPSTVDRSVPDYLTEMRGPVAGMRIGVVRDFGEGSPAFQPEIIANTEALLQALAAQGATVEETSLPVGMGDFRRTLSTINWSESYSIHEKDFLERHQLMGRALRDKMMSGAMVRAADYLAAQRYRRQIALSFDAVMQGFDAIVMPTTSVTAPAFGDQEALVQFTFGATTAIQNVTGHPALAIATGFDAEGMPTSAQITGKLFDEATLYRIGAAWEAVSDTRDRRPTL